MRGKSNVSKEVAEAIEYFRFKGYADSTIVSMAATGGLGRLELALVNYGADNLMKALVNGYVVEKKAEESVREYFEHFETSAEEAVAIQRTLDILGIKIAEVNK